MGLQDRDWYHDALKDKQHTNGGQKTADRGQPPKRQTGGIGPIWTEQHLYRHEKRKATYGLWLLRFCIWAPTTAFLAYVITELAENH